MGVLNPATIFFLLLLSWTAQQAQSRQTETQKADEMCVQPSAMEWRKTESCTYIECERRWDRKWSTEERGLLGWTKSEFDQALETCKEDFKLKMDEIKCKWMGGHGWTRYPQKCMKLKKMVKMEKM